MTALLFPVDLDPVDANGVRFGIDWMAFTVKRCPRAQLVQILWQVLGDEWKVWEVMRSGDGWERCRGPHGSLMEVQWREGWVHVQIKGRGCRAVGVDALLWLHDVLFAKVGDGYRVKRVDLAWDDYQKRLTPKEFRERFWDVAAKQKRPEVLCRARGGHLREDDSVRGGGSYQVGERLSDRMLRVYDKAAQSGGKVDAIRFELECKNRVAVHAMAAMAAAGGNRSAAALRMLVGFVDFREVADGLPPQKRRRCAWWEELVADARRAVVGAPERSGLVEWRGVFTKQNSSGFRVLARLNGGDLLAAAEELFRANRRDNPRHAAWHAEIVRDGVKRPATEGDPGPGSGGAAA